MPSSRNRVFVTGLGMVTPFGVGRERFWSGVVASRSASRKIDAFDVEGFPTPFACTIDDAEFDPGKFVSNAKSIKLMPSRFRTRASDPTNGNRPGAGSSTVRGAWDSTTWITSEPSARFPRSSSPADRQPTSSSSLAGI